MPTAANSAVRLGMIFRFVPPLRGPAVPASEHAAEDLQRRLATTRSTRTAAAGLLQAESSSFWWPEHCRRTGTRASTRMPVCFCVYARAWAFRLISCNRGACVSPYENMLASASRKPRVVVAVVYEWCLRNISESEMCRSHHSRCASADRKRPHRAASIQENHLKGRILAR